MIVLALIFYSFFFAIAEICLGILLRFTYKANDMVSGSVIIVGMGAMGFFGFLIISSLIRML